MVAAKSGVVQEASINFGEAYRRDRSEAELIEAQVQALEKKQDDDVAHGEIDTAHPGYPDSQDTFYAGTLKGVGRIYQQIFVNTYSKWATAKPYHQNTNHIG